MAKKISPAPAPAEPPKSQFLTTKHSFRVERLSQFEFQAFKVTRNDDGSYSEEKFGHSTVFDLVMRRVFESLGKDANAVFQQNKALMKKTEGEKAL